jgi:hypothetical protein
VNVNQYFDLKRRVIEAGYAAEIDWAHDIKPCPNALEFWREFSWVVICSGMKAQIARQIWDRVQPEVESGGSARAKFGHKGKAAAIDRIWREKEALFNAYAVSLERLDFLETLPWIGPITKFHLAKNLGINVPKPDRHLERIAGSIEAVEPLCRRLAALTGDRITEVDTVIWRAANLGFI